MKDTSKTLRRKGIFRFAISLTAAAAILGAMVSLPFDTGKAAPGASEVVKELYKTSGSELRSERLAAFAERPPGNIRAARRSQQP